MCLFLKLDTNALVLLLRCAPGPPSPLYILVRFSLRFSVKGAVYSDVRDLQFLGNFSHGIALISQNKNRLKFQKKVLFLAIFLLLLFFNFYPFFSPISWCPIV